MTCIWREGGIFAAVAARRLVAAWRDDDNGRPCAGIRVAAMHMTASCFVPCVNCAEVAHVCAFTYGIEKLLMFTQCTPTRLP